MKSGRVVKGVNFVDFRDAGDPAELAAAYEAEGADELVFLDIAASSEGRKTKLEWVGMVAGKISLPFAVGGGILSLFDAAGIIETGAQKISINTAAVKNPGLIAECAKELGSAAVVVAVDAKKISESPGRWEVCIGGGMSGTGLDVIDWCKRAEELGAGEILLTSIDRDGTKEGYDIELLKTVSSMSGIPMVASGGAGGMRHALEAFEAGADAALMASVFHFGEIRIADLKRYLLENGVPVRL